MLDRTALRRVLLNSMMLGTTENQRIGRIIRVTNIGVHGIIESNIASTGVSDPTLISIWIVYDKQPNGTPISDTQLLQYGVGAAVGDSPSSQFLNMANANRFVVLKHHMVTLGPHEKGSGHTGFTGSPMTDLVRWNLDVDLETVFNNLSNNAISSIVTGSIYMLGCADTTQSTGVPPNTNDSWKLQYHARIRFVDG